MATFFYAARDGAGEAVSGSFSALDRAAALSHLRARALTVTALTPALAASQPRSWLTMLPVDETARVALFRALATMMTSAVPLRRALDVAIAQTSNARLREALRCVTSDLEMGHPLSVSMERRPREFGRLQIAMIRAGEIGGTLDAVLERIATLLERDRATRKRVRAALSYPAVVVVAALALIVFLVSTTIPTFSAMFAQMHVALPLSTRMLIVVGRWVGKPITWCLFVAVCAALTIGVPLVRKQPTLAQRADRLLLALPVVGSIARAAILARLTRTLGMLLRSGVPLVTALTSCADVVDNTAFSQLLRDVERAVAQGDPLSGPIAQSGLFDALSVQLVHVGEESACLDGMLLKIAEYCEIEVETAISTLGSVLEPLLIIVLGAIVGTIVASILIPLYSVIGSIK